MYLEHFGLREFPFQLTPDTSFFFAGSRHQQALNTLLLALNSGEGFVKLTADIGLGKTLLCRKLLSCLGPRFVTAYIPNPLIPARTLQMQLADELGCAAHSAGNLDLFQTINHRLIEIAKKGQRVVLFVDEAQVAPDGTLEMMRLLSNLETETFKLLQLVLIGQPELDRRLARPTLRQLRQRIGFSEVLGPLDYENFTGYVRHRLQVAGYGGGPLFTNRALRVLHHASRGIPRVINILCHKSLMAAYGPGELQVGAAHARAAVDDTEDTRSILSMRIWPLASLARGNVGVLAAATLLSLSLAYLLRTIS